MSRRFNPWVSLAAAGLAVLLIGVWLLPFLVLPAFGAMTDIAAMNQAKVLFGPLAMIGQRRGLTDTYWSKIVGVYSPGCLRDDMWVGGTGSNTWESAFAAVPVTWIRGPYAGMVSLQGQAWSSAGVVSFTWLLDGAPVLAPLTFQTPVQNEIAISPWDTTRVANGVHVLCATATDVLGNSDGSHPVVIRVDQTMPSIAQSIVLQQKGPPSLTAISIRRQ